MCSRTVIAALRSRDEQGSSRAIAYLMLASAPYVFATGAVLPTQAPLSERAVVAFTCLVLVAGGCACLCLPHAIPGFVRPVAPFIAVFIITGLNLITSDASIGSHLFYLWPLLYSAMYLSRRLLLLVLAVIFAGDGSVIFLLYSDTGQAWADWTALMLSLAMSAVVVMLLRERAERLLAVLQSQALADPLTGLANRRRFDRELILAEAWSRGGGSLALLSVDIDHFKAINDTWGHAGGDVALQTVASALQSVERETDLAARLGGDEFVLLLRGDRRDALRVTDAFRKAISARTDTPGGPPQLSIGVAVLPDDATTVAALVAASDAALYKAKTSGRGRMTWAAPLGPEPSSREPDDHVVPVRPGHHRASHALRSAGLR